MVINGRKNMMNSKELSSVFAQCIGTENYYRLNPFHLIYTDGVKAFAENAEAYWFLTDLAVYLKRPELSGEYFLQIKLNVDEKKLSAFLTIDDGNGNELFNHFYNYTDCPAGEWTFFYVSNVLMVPNEY